jgi:two-component system response regulator AtoC
LLLSQAGRSDAPLLLRGETGVGKEVLAREFHAVSPRAHHPFLKLNCAALPPDLVESELFGYERGAFSGAFQSTPGKFAMAAGGTVLLDEIGDMDLRLQAKLLQVVQDKEFIRLGSKQTTQVDVRVMAATHRDLERAIAEGTFREDLFYRLNIIDIYVPPLRERRGEILGLAAFFLRKHSGNQEPPEIPPLLEDALLEHDWPGNVRELENVMRKLLVLRNAECLAEDLRSRSRRKSPVMFPPGVVAVPHEIPKALGIAVASDQVLHGSGSAAGSPAGRWNGSGAGGAETRAKSPLARVHDARNAAEAEAIVTALSSTHWNRKRAAAVLQIEYKALLYKMKKLGIGTKAPDGHRQSNGRAGEPEPSTASHACA